MAIADSSKHYYQCSCGELIITSSPIESSLMKRVSCVVCGADLDLFKKVSYQKVLEADFAKWAEMAMTERFMGLLASDDPGVAKESAAFRAGYIQACKDRHRDRHAMEPGTGDYFK